MPITEIIPHEIHGKTYIEGENHVKTVVIKFGSGDDYAQEMAEVLEILLNENNEPDQPII